MKKILLIGQAPPLQKQEIPYDTTMLYDWLSQINITKEKALEIFDFESMTDKPPKISENGSHLPPSKKEMLDYWKRVLLDKVELSDKIILLGACPRKFFEKDSFFKRYDNKKFKVLTLIHPSKRNYKMYKDNKELILSLLKNIIEE